MRRALVARASFLTAVAAAVLTAACSDDPSTGAADAAPTAADATPITGEPRALVRHDVSVLWPLPPAGQDSLLAATDSGLGGPLVPRARFDAIGLSVVKDLETADEEYAALRVVAIRFDPCFIHQWGGATCQAQIRLVLQAVDVDGGTTFDGALHALYNLTDAEFTVVASELRALTAAAPEQADAEAPLGVSPALVAQGTDGAYAQNLRALVLRHVGEGNLARLTFMTRTDARAGEWQFGGHAIIERIETGFGPPGPIEILGLDGATIQKASQNGGEGFAFEVMPGLAEDVGLLGLDEVVLLARSAKDRADVEAWALAVQNPMQTSPDSTDCLSCHVGGHVTRVLEAADPGILPDGVVRGPRVITTAEAEKDNLRAFGYFGATPYVSQRTANDTEFTLLTMAQRFPASP